MLRALYIDQAKFPRSSWTTSTPPSRSAVSCRRRSREATYGLRDVADQFVASLYTGAQSANQIGTVSVTTAALAYTQLRKLSVKLDKANVPMEGRWVVVPPSSTGCCSRTTASCGSTPQAPPPVCATA